MLFLVLRALTGSANRFNRALHSKTMASPDGQTTRVSSIVCVAYRAFAIPRYLGVER
jgi:hypothetical protein